MPKNNRKANKPLDFVDKAGAEVTKAEVNEQILEAAEEGRTGVIKTDLESPESLLKSPGTLSPPDVPVTDFVKRETIPAKEEAPKKEYTRQFITNLRHRDRATNKTCAGCATRKPLAEMDNGKAEKCDSCRK